MNQLPEHFVNIASWGEAREWISLFRHEVVVFKEDTDRKPYPCRCMESATKLVERFIAGVTKPRPASEPSSNASKPASPTLVPHPLRPPGIGAIINLATGRLSGPPGAYHSGSASLDSTHLKSSHPAPLPPVPASNGAYSLTLAGCLTMPLPATYLTIESCLENSFPDVDYPSTAWLPSSTSPTLVASPGPLTAIPTARASTAVALRTAAGTWVRDVGLKG